MLSKNPPGFSLSVSCPELLIFSKTIGEVMKKKTKVKPSGKSASKSKSTTPPSPASPAKLKQSAERSGAQEALQITWLLKGNLKNARIGYLRIGALLIQIRDKKLYSELAHPDIEDYAEKRLKLGKSSLYQYIQVYDWVQGSHPEWLMKKVKGFIPDLSDVADLMWIESELKRADLNKEDRVQLENLRKKGFAGELRQSQMEEFRKKGQKVNTIKAYLNKFCSFRTRCARIVGMPAEVIRCLDAAIEILKNRQQVAECGFNVSDIEEKFV
jgi:hypothetical protein